MDNGVERTDVSGKIFLLREDRIVRIEFDIKGGDLGVKYNLVCLQTPAPTPRI
jgi:hypothetical protein